MCRGSAHSLWTAVPSQHQGESSSISEKKAEKRSKLQLTGAFRELGTGLEIISSQRSRSLSQPALRWEEMSVVTAVI